MACSLALAQLGVATDEVIGRLISGLEDSDLTVRVDCEEALRTISAQSVPLLAEVAAGRAIQVQGEGEVKLTLNGRLVAIKVLGSTQEAAAARCLIKLLNDPAEIVRYRAVAALGCFQGAQACEALERAAREDSSRRVRTRAKEALQSVKLALYQGRFGL
jgi:HEAT repeat protein